MIGQQTGYRRRAVGAAASHSCLHPPPSSVPSSLSTSTMSSESEPGGRRVPTLVQHCQRGELSSITPSVFTILTGMPTSGLCPCREYVSAALSPSSRQLTTAYDAPVAEKDICSLGEGWRYDLIKPVLESCTPETLLRFEQADPVRLHPRHLPRLRW